MTCKLTLSSVALIWNKKDFMSYFLTHNQAESSNSGFYPRWYRLFFSVPFSSIWHERGVLNAGVCSLDSVSNSRVFWVSTVKETKTPSCPGEAEPSRSFFGPERNETFLVLFMQFKCNERAFLYLRHTFYFESVQCLFPSDGFVSECLIFSDFIV